MIKPGIVRAAAAAGLLLVLPATGETRSAAAPAPESERARAESLLKEGDRLARSRDYRTALDQLHQALEIGEGLDDPILTFRALNLLASIADGRGDYAEGASLHGRALALARRLGDRRLEASVLAGIGSGLWRQADYTGAMDHLKLALDLQDRIGDRAGKAATLVAMGRVYFKQGLYREAVEHHRRALSIQEADGDLAAQAVTLEDIGDVSLEQGAYAGAIEYFEKSLVLRGRAGDRIGQIDILTVIGTAYMRQGAAGLAAERFEEALRLSRGADVPAGSATALYHLGIARSRQGRFREASECLLAASRLHEQLDDQRALAWDLSFLASAHERLGDYAAAAEGYRKTIEVRERIQDVRALASELSDLAEVQEKLGQDREALATYQRALALDERINLPYRSLTLGRIGMIHARAGDTARAMEFGRRALEAADATGNPELRWSALHAMGVILRRSGRRPEALDRLQAALAIIEGLRAGVSPLDEARRGYMEGKQEIYEETVTLLLEMGRAREALEISERARSRAFLDLLGDREPVAGGIASDGEVTTRGAQDSSRARFSEVPPLDFPRIVEELSRRGATLLEYMMTEDRTCVWVVRPDGSITARAFTAGRGEIEGLVGRMRDELLSATTTGGGEDLKRILRRLHAILVEPVADHLPAEPGQLVTIVPHGPLFLVSFASLLDSDGRYFVERHALNYSPGASVLRFARPPIRPVVGEPRILLVGNPAGPPVPGIDTTLPPLPGAEEEVETIRRLYREEQVRVLRGAAAEEGVVRDLARRARVLHLATHGIFRDDDPMESLIVLAPGGGGPEQDGIWSAWEVLRARLDADLVILSACDTGLGRITGDGVIGMSRAFLYSGARSVIVSLWRLADVTGRFEMEKFHAAFQSGAAKAASLRTAQIETIKALRAGRLATASGRTLEESPVFWAPFILIGESD